MKSPDLDAYVRARLLNARAAWSLFREHVGQLVATAVLVVVFVAPVVRLAWLYVRWIWSIGE